MDEYGKRVAKKMESYMGNTDSVAEEISDIQNAQKGVEVRGALAAGVKKAFDKSKTAQIKSEEATEITQNLLDDSFDTSKINANFEQRLDTEIANLQPEWTGFKDDVTSQLAETDDQINIMQTNKVYVETFPRLAVEMNDTARVERAINYAESGAVIEFKPNETYELTSVNVTKSLTIDLNGCIVKNIGNAKIFWLKNDKTTVKNGFFALLSSTLAESMAIYAENRKGITIENCTFDSSYYGIHLFNCSNVRIRNNVGNLSRHWDIYIVSGTDVIIQDNSVFNGEYDGVKVAGLQSGGVLSTTDIIIKNNVCYNNKRDGIDVAINEGNRILIDGNTLNNNLLKGIDLKTLEHSNPDEVYSIKGVLITNNIIQLPELTQSDGIAIQGRNAERKILDVTLSGNKIITSTQPSSNQYGISLLRVTKATIKGNQINGSTHGIVIGLSTIAKIRNNIIEVRLNCVIAEVCQKAVIKLNDLTSEITSPVLVRQSVGYLEVGDNDMNFPRSTSYSTSYLNTTYETLVLYNNKVDFRNVKPASRGTIGDVVINTDLTINKIEKWICTTTSSAPDWRAVNLVA